MTAANLFIALVLIVGFYMSWNIGANDVSNAMGTAVGSGAVTLKKAVILAAVLEFSGAFFFGGHVSDTLQKGIIQLDAFRNDPLHLALGMFSALIATSLWLQLSSYFGWPVSTTHAIVGAIIGFGLIVGGTHAVHFNEIGSIVLSWIISPLISGLFSYAVFKLLQKKIFFSLHPAKKTLTLVPYLFSACVLMFAMIVTSHHQPLLSIGPIQLPGWIVALFLGMVAGIGGSIYARRYSRRLNIGMTPQEEYHHVETSFASLQILSACCVAFAHGANDVANAIGPVASILEIISHPYDFSARASIPVWLLALGGAGIVLGLATWGWRVIETIGKKITELTPTRGFSAEIGAAATILIATRLGLPISTTHCVVGSVLGVGLAKGMMSINLSILKEIILSWVITIPASGTCCILIYYLLKMLVKDLALF